jgi:hypothetical protein
MPRVLFTQRSGAYWPGASPVLEEEVVARLLANGTAVPYTEATMKKIKESEVKAGADIVPPGNTKGQPVIVTSAEPVPTEYEPKLRGTTGPLKAIGKTEADKEEDEELAKADKAAERQEAAAPAKSRGRRKAADKPAKAPVVKAANARAVKANAKKADAQLKKDTKK